jgi:hypothetical protein
MRTQTILLGKESREISLTVVTSNKFIRKF